jgi:Uma2 family endonuclease
MSTARRYLPHYTVADYRQWEGDWELWQGIPVAMTPSPFGRHQRCSLRLARSLLSAIEAGGCHAEVLQEIDWIVSDDTVLRPDVLVVCGDVPEGHVTESPTLVAEILSASTADRDRNDKLRLYEDNGVSHYLIVDPNDNTLVSCSRNAQGKFSQLESADFLDFMIFEDCHIALDVASIF